MKVRTDFVTNSSSSSFVLEIRFSLENGSDIVFYAHGGTPETGRVDYFEGNATVTISPKKLGLAKDVNELIQLLTDGVLDGFGYDNGYDRETRIKIFAKSNPVQSDLSDEVYDAYEFIKNLKENITYMDDIAEVTIIGNEYNYMNYEQSYTYNRKTGEYVGTVSGYDFEKDGSSGGALCFSVEDCDVTYYDAEEEDW